MEPLGTLLFAGCRLPVVRASFRYVSDGNDDPRSDEEVPGWDFDLAFCKDRSQLTNALNLVHYPEVRQLLFGAGHGRHH